MSSLGAPWAGWKGRWRSLGFGYGGWGYLVRGSLEEGLYFGVCIGGHLILGNCHIDMYR